MLNPKQPTLYLFCIQIVMLNVYNLQGKSLSKSIWLYVASAAAFHFGYNKQVVSEQQNEDSLGSEILHFRKAVSFTLTDCKKMLYKTIENNFQEPFVNNLSSLFPSVKGH